MENNANASSETKVCVFIPESAKLNFQRTPLPPPRTMYNDSMQIFDQDTVKKIVKGIYGRDASKNK
jgi:hypothetical protein